MTDCAGVGEVPHTLLPQELLSLQSTGWHLSVGAEQDLMETWLPVQLPGGGCTISCPQPRASPCHTCKEGRTRSIMSLAPWLPLSSP